MSALLSHRYWGRADAPGRIALQQALAGLQPGQRLRLSDVVGRQKPAPVDAVADAPKAAADQAQREAVPALVDYTSTAIRAGSVDPQTREVEFSFSSEAPYERWWGVEILGHGAGECDMSWVASARAPFLSDHDADEQIGVITRAWTDRAKRQNRAIAKFGKGADAEEEMQDAMDAVRVNISVGYEIRELELVKKDGDLATYRVTDWLPLECSLVAIPADMTVGLGRSVSQDSPELETPAPSLPAQPRKEQTMTQVAEKPQAGDDAFRTNAATISRLADAYAKWLKPGDESRAIAAGADPQKFNELLMERMQSGATDITTLPALGASKKEQRSYSFLRAIQSMIPGSGVDGGFERELSQEIAKTTGRAPEGIFIPSDVMAGQRARAQRDFTAGTAGEAGNLVQTDVMSSMWTDVLRPALTLGQMGITILPGLTSNVAVPRKSVAGTLAMLTEVAAASETQPTTVLATLSPKRVSAYSEPSKQAIIQSQVGVEAMIRDDLLSGAAVLLESQGISGSGSSPNARGIRLVSGVGSVAGGARGLNLAWSHITGLEAACANANAASTARAGYLVNTKVVNTAKNTVKATNLPFIWDGGTNPLNGYAVGVTNNVPSNLTKGASVAVCSSLIFSSDWSMFVLGLFGGLDVTVDPYTLATTGQIRITLNQFYDWLCRQPGAFAVMDDALTP